MTSSILTQGPAGVHSSNHSWGWTLFAPALAILVTVVGAVGSQSWAPVILLAPGVVSSIVLVVWAFRLRHKSLEVYLSATETARQAYWVWLALLLLAIGHSVVPELKLSGDFTNGLTAFISLGVFLQTVGPAYSAMRKA